MKEIRSHIAHDGHQTTFTIYCMITRDSNKQFPILDEEFDPSERTVRIAIVNGRLVGCSHKTSINTRQERHKEECSERVPKDLSETLTVHFSIK